MQKFLRETNKGETRVDSDWTHTHTHTWEEVGCIPIILYDGNWIGSGELAPEQLVLIAGLEIPQSVRDLCQPFPLHSAALFSILAHYVVLVHQLGINLLCVWDVMVTRDWHRAVQVQSVHVRLAHGGFCGFWKAAENSLCQLISLQCSGDWRCLFKKQQ